MDELGFKWADFVKRTIVVWVVWWGSERGGVESSHKKRVGIGKIEREKLIWLMCEGNILRNIGSRE